MKTQDLVFVVDDSEIFLSLFSGFLLKKGKYEIKSFSNGLKMLRELYLKPKAILIDYYLDSSDRSALNGKEIVEVLKLIHERYPVIVFSGNCNREKVEELKQIGIKDFIFKGEHNFLEKMEEALKKIIS